MTDIIKLVKDFGIDEKDVKTQRVSVNEFEERRTNVKQWRASNSITITLRDIDKASAFTDLLSSSDATNVSGPRFTLDDTQAAEVDLLELAIDNAREKAEAIAKASDRRLGKILTVTESGASYRNPMPLVAEMKAGGAPAPIEPGTQTVYKTVTVIFELK